MRILKKYLQCLPNAPMSNKENSSNTLEKVNIALKLPQPLSPLYEWFKRVLPCISLSWNRFVVAQRRQPHSEHPLRWSVYLEYPLKGWFRMVRRGCSRSGSLRARFAACCLCRCRGWREFRWWTSFSFPYFGCRMECTDWRRFRRIGRPCKLCLSG